MKLRESKVKSDKIRTKLRAPGQGGQEPQVVLSNPTGSHNHVHYRQITGDFMQEMKILIRISKME